MTTGDSQEAAVISALRNCFIPSEIFHRPLKQHDSKELCDVLVCTPLAIIAIQTKGGSTIENRLSSSTQYYRSQRFCLGAINQLRGCFRHIRSATTLTCEDISGTQQTIQIDQKQLFFGMVITRQNDDKLHNRLHSMSLNDLIFHYFNLDTVELNSLCCLAQNHNNLINYIHYRIRSKHTLLSKGIREWITYSYWSLNRTQAEALTKSNCIVDLAKSPLGRIDFSFTTEQRASRPFSALHSLLSDISLSQQASEDRQSQLDPVVQSTLNSDSRLGYQEIINQVRQLPIGEYAILESSIQRHFNACFVHNQMPGVAYIAYSKHCAPIIIFMTKNQELGVFQEYIQAAMAYLCMTQNARRAIVFAWNQDETRYINYIASQTENKSQITQTIDSIKSEHPTIHEEYSWIRDPRRHLILR